MNKKDHVDALVAEFKKTSPLFKIFAGADMEFVRAMVQNGIRFSGDCTIEQVLANNAYYYHEATLVDHRIVKKGITTETIAKSSRWYTKYDISLELNGNVFTRWFTKLPEVSFESIIEVSTVKNSIYLDQVHYAKELIRRFGTPHVDEILTLRLLPQILPQPIAEVIADCMYGVIARRFKYSTFRSYYPWNTIESRRHEAAYTLLDIYGELSDVDIAPDMSWEDAAHAEYLHIEAKKLAPSNSSEDECGVSCCYGDPSYSYFGEDDGW